MTEKDYSGMTLVDNYWIPDEEVEAYVAERNFYRDRIMEIAQNYFPTVTTAFYGSEDGEAVVAYRSDGSFRFLIHLDPMRISEMKEADEQGELEEYFIEVCEITEEKRSDQSPPIRLIAIDMDATLLRDDKTYDEQRFDRIAKKLMDNGVKLMIASGNSYPKLDYYLSHMDRDHIYFAGDNGNYMKLGEQLIHKLAMDEDQLQAVIEFLTKQGGYSLLFSDGLDCYSRWIDPKYASYIHIYYDQIIPLDNWDELQRKGIVKLACHSPRNLAESKEIVDQINQDFDDLTAVTSGGGWMDIYASGGGKGAAVQLIQEKFAIPPSQTMVFGDSLNDASMFQVADFAMAMDNSDDDLKKIASHVIGSNEEQAVIQVLEEYGEVGDLSAFKKYRQ